MSDRTARTVGRTGTRRRRRRSSAPRRGIAGGSHPGVPVADSGGVWVRKGLRDVRNPPGATAEVGEAQRGAGTGGGGSVR